MSSQGGTRYGTYVANWTYGIHMPVLDARTWPRGTFLAWGRPTGTSVFKGGWIVTFWFKA
jgi:hypothetical protein